MPVDRDDEPEGRGEAVAGSGRGDADDEVRDVAEGPGLSPLPPVWGASPLQMYGVTAALSIDSPRLERNGLLGGPYVPERPSASVDRPNHPGWFVRCGERSRPPGAGGYAPGVIATHDAQVVARPARLRGAVATPERRGEGRRRRRRRRLHRDVGGLAPRRARARREGRAARGGGLRARAERAQRRLLQRDVVLAAELRRRWGDAGALAVARAAEEAVAGIGRFCEEQGVDAWYRPAGYLQVSTAAAHDGVWADGARGLPRARRAGRAAAARPRRRSPSAAPRRPSAAAPSTPTAATVQPARLALGLRERLLAAGVEVFESSPVRARSATAPDGVEARTAGGAVARRRGGAGDRRRRARAARPAARPAHRRLLPHRPHRAGARPARGARLDRRRVHHRQPRPGPLLPHHPRRPDRLRLGRRPDRDAAPPPRPRRARPRGRRRRSPRTSRAFFPRLAGRASTHAWGGPIDASPTHLPLVPPLRGGRAFAAAGYTGNGVGPSHMVGRTLASLALDRRDEPSRLAFVDPAAPRPPRALPARGGAIIRRRDPAQGGRRGGGSRAGAFTRFVCGIPERIGIRVGR